MASGIVESSAQGQETHVAAPGVSRAKLVQRLLAAGANLPAFIHDLLTTQAILVAGTEAAAFLIERTGEESFELKPVAHLRPDQGNPEARAAAMTAFQNLIRPCVEQGKEGAIEVGVPDGNGEPQYCLATLLRNEGQVVAVTAVITRCLNVDRAKQRLSSMELVAGYFDLYMLRRVSEQSKQIAQSHQHVLQLSSAVATAEGFESAAMNLCNELATRTGAVRVSIGWVKGDRIKVAALSHTEKFDKKQELIVQLRQVMEECLDQEEPVHYEPTGGGTENVTREAQNFSRMQGGNGILSLPLRRGSEIVGVMTLEFSADKKLGENSAAGLAVAADILAPQLYDRYQNDRWLIVKAGQSIRETAKLAIGPKHMLAKCLIVLGLLAVLVVCDWVPFVDLRMMYKASAPFQFSPIEKRTVCSPAAGFLGDLATIDGAKVQPGTRVKKGQLLVTLDTTELELKLAQARSRANSLQKEADDKRSKGKTAEALISLEQKKEALAEAGLYEYQINQSRIVSPVDGEILKGDLRDKKDSPVKEGDMLFEIAERGHLEAELSVAERDIQVVKVGQKGKLATNSLPSDTFGFKVDRIVPLGEPKDGENIFRVYATMEEKSADWRPGMVGEARVEIGKRPIGWVWTHRLVDFLRLKLWV